jgi:hypothetical protein
MVYHARFALKDSSDLTSDAFAAPITLSTSAPRYSTAQKSTINARRYLLQQILPA